jgi:L-amino acid N-acyltransferase YncA
MRIRDAGAADASAFQAIYAHAVETGTTSFETAAPDTAAMAARIAAAHAGGYPCLVCVDDTDVVIGYAYAGAYRPRPAYRWTVEDTVYVHPGYLRRGVGRMLLGALVERCAAAGFRRMIAVIGGDAPEASIALHRRHGFDLCGVIPDLGFKHGRWLNTTLMQRPLGEGAATPPDAV